MLQYKSSQEQLDNGYFLKRQREWFHWLTGFSPTVLINEGQQSQINHCGLEQRTKVTKDLPKRPTGGTIPHNDLKRFMKTQKLINSS